MFLQKLDEILLDNKGNRNTEAQLIGLRTLIVAIHDQEVAEKRKNWEAELNKKGAKPCGENKVLPPRKEKVDHRDKAI